MREKLRKLLENSLAAFRLLSWSGAKQIHWLTSQEDFHLPVGELHLEFQVYYPLLLQHKCEVGIDELEWRNFETIQFILSSMAEDPSFDDHWTYSGLIDKREWGIIREHAKRCVNTLQKTLP